MNTENTAQEKAQEKCTACADWESKYLHLAADYQNYQRRTEKDRILWVTRAQEDILMRVLKIIDDFDRALAQHQDQKGNQSLDAWIAGFTLISKSFDKLLSSYGITKIAVTTIFDPELHEAVAQVVAHDKKSGTIVEVFEAGYMMGDRVLRPAKVSVAQ
ncbi:MAG: nucleotide exchange factor GrpE [Candidatus Babeliales bacterium]